MSIRLNDDAAYVATLREGLRRKDGHCPCRLERTAETRCPCKEGGWFWGAPRGRRGLKNTYF